ncbi:MAG: 5-formyltetrahydrofolate cyclo-ligase [Bacillota bacterium]
MAHGKPPLTPNADKSAWRVWAGNILDSLSDEERRIKSRSICNNILSWPLYKEAVSIGAFMPYGREIDIRPILEHAVANEKILSLPKVVASNGSLIFHRIRALESDLYPGYRGIMEPGGMNTQSPTFHPDLLIIPGLVYDLRGYRLGHGKGFYDNFLVSLQHPVVTLGVAYRLLLVEMLPVEIHDIPVDAVATEEGIHYVQGRRV